MNVCGHAGPSFRWVDESNAAVTNAANRNPLCRDCYTARYGTPREFLRPVEADLWRQSDGVLGVHNLLSSGDYELRDFARSRFTIQGGRVVFAGQESGRLI